MADLSPKISIIALNVNNINTSMKREIEGVDLKIYSNYKLS